MRKLDDHDTRVLLALVQERERAAAAVERFVAFLGDGMEKPTIERRPDGLWLVDGAEGELGEAE